MPDIEKNRLTLDISELIIFLNKFNATELLFLGNVIIQSKDYEVHELLNIFRTILTTKERELELAGKAAYNDPSIAVSSIGYRLHEFSNEELYLLRDLLKSRKKTLKLISEHKYDGEFIEEDVEATDLLLVVVSNELFRRRPTIKLNLKPITKD